MKVSDYIVEFLKAKKIDCIFGYIGGAVTHLVDSAYKIKGIQFVQTYHEQTAAIAAEGYSRVSSGEKIGVAIATSGPGATNLITGIADAYFDSIPALYITGQVNTYEYKYDKPIRQQGFQETDVVSIVKPITKYAVMVDDVTKIKYELEKAFYLACSGRKGPVLLDIPMDIQRSEIKPDNLIGFTPEPLKERSKSLIEKLEEAVQLINQSKRPMLLLGGGVLQRNAEKEIAELIAKFQIPVVVSLLGKGSIDEDYKYFLGMIGSYGIRCANIATANADLLLSLGARLDTRQTGTVLDSFIRDGKIIRVDIDDNELNNHRLTNTLNLNLDLVDFLDFIQSKINVKEDSDSTSWLKYISEIKDKFSQTKEIKKNLDYSLPYNFINCLNELTSDNSIYFSDIGQNQMWAAQMLKLDHGRKFYTSGGLAPMGYSLPAAIGASFAAESEREIVAIMGDGGFHMATQSLMLISQYNLPVKVIVLNNSALGMITQFQELYFQNNRYATTENHGYLVPNIQDMAKSYSLDYFKIDEENILDEEYLRKVLTARNGIINVILKHNTKVVPKLEFNNPLEDTSPMLDRETLKNNMLIDLYKATK